MCHFLQIGRDEVTWPTEEEWADILKKFNPWRMCCCCGWNTASVNRTFQRKHFSVLKKKQHSLNALFIVLLDGRIIYHSPLDAGSCDQNILNNKLLSHGYESVSMTSFIRIKENLLELLLSLPFAKWPLPPHLHQPLDLNPPHHTILCTSPIFP